jgi:hypothetical protein
MVTKSQNSLIARIADALDRLAPLPPNPAISRVPAHLSGTPHRQSLSPLPK